jgi:hypothetical protein
MRGVRIAVALCAILAPAALALSAAAEPATAPSTTPATDLRDIPPIMFFIAKGEPDACGPGCNEWIGAHGMFDDGAPQRLRAVLAKAGKRKLPIYFFSPGGSVPASMAVGRIMRVNKIKASVGRTVPQGCDPKQVREKACDAIMRSGRELSAELITPRATCNSSCVYALLGATEREIPAGASLGVHSISIRRTLVKQDQTGRVLATKSTRITGDTPDIRAAHDRVARYAAEMGFSRAIVDAAAAVPFEKVRYLKREEIVQFGIDPRAFAESRWMREEDKSGRAGLIKYMIGAAAGEPKRYRMTLMRLSCAPTRRILVQIAREQAPAEKVAVAVMVGGNEVALRAFGKPRKGDGGLETEVRAAVAMPAYFEEAVKAGRLELVETPEGAAVQRTTLSTAGLAGLAGLGEECR